MVSTRAAAAAGGIGAPGEGPVAIEKAPKETKATAAADAMLEINGPKGALAGGGYWSERSREEK